jgi:hypothetical protein
MSGRPPDELCAGYEALRAAATGGVLSETPRGFALLLAQGLAAWMQVVRPLPPALPIAPAGSRPVAAVAGQEMVRVLTEMALGSRRELAT